MTSQAPNYHGYRFPPEIISHAVWLYHRFCLVRPVMGRLWLGRKKIAMCGQPQPAGVLPGGHHACLHRERHPRQHTRGLGRLNPHDFPLEVQPRSQTLGHARRQGQEHIDGRLRL